MKRMVEITLPVKSIIDELKSEIVRDSSVDYLLERKIRAIIFTKKFLNEMKDSLNDNRVERG